MAHLNDDETVVKMGHPALMQGSIWADLTEPEADSSAALRNDKVRSDGYGGSAEEGWGVLPGLAEVGGVVADVAYFVGDLPCGEGFGIVGPEEIGGWAGGVGV
jgi:hypothetical protein